MSTDFLQPDQNSLHDGNIQIPQIGQKLTTFAQVSDTVLSKAVINIIKKHHNFIPKKLPNFYTNFFTFY